MEDINRLSEILRDIRSYAISGSEEAPCSPSSGYAASVCEEIIKLSEEAAALCAAILRGKG